MHKLRHPSRFKNYAFNCCYSLTMSQLKMFLKNLSIRFVCVCVCTQVCVSCESPAISVSHCSLNCTLATGDHWLLTGFGLTHQPVSFGEVSLIITSTVSFLPHHRGLTTFIFTPSCSRSQSPLCQ